MAALLGFGCGAKTAAAGSDAGARDAARPGAESGIDATLDGREDDGPAEEPAPVQCETRATLFACPADVPFCCTLVHWGWGRHCCCEDPSTCSACGCDPTRCPGLPDCVEAIGSAIETSCGSSSDCPAAKPYCCIEWGGRTVCAAHALYGWDCTSPSSR